MKIGFIGLGNLGSPMAARLIPGHSLIVWDRDAERMKPLKAMGAQLADSIADLGSSCELVSLCVFNDQDVNDVCASLLPAMRPGGIIVIHTTANPALCIALAEKAKLRGLALIDAPVSGGAPGATAGTLAVMIGGDAEVVAKARPVFEAFGQLIVHLGAVGAGQNAKIINNAILAATMGVAHRALSAADTLGLDRKALVEIIKVSTGQSRGLEVYAGQSHLQAFAMGAHVLVKDMRLLDETLGHSADFLALQAIAAPYLEAVLPPEAMPRRGTD